MKQLKILGIIIFLFTGMVSFSAQNAAKGLSKINHGDWEKLGNRIVNMQADHDEIPVTIQDGVFTKVKLKIMKSPIHLLNMRVIFGNGEDKSVVFNKKFPAGSETRIIDLPGNKRIIKKVNLNYKSAPAGNGRSVISLWGKH